MSPKPFEPKHKTVMLIDDSEIDNLINSMMIKGAGFAENVYVHSSAVSSLEFLKNMEGLQNVSQELIPSFLFLDINMPILDGFQFLDEFSTASSFLKKEMKIVILSSSDNFMDREKAKQYEKVVKFLPKPLTEEDLVGLNNL